MIQEDAIYNNIDNIAKNCLILFGKGYDDGEKGLREKATFQLDHKRRAFCAETKLWAYSSYHVMPRGSKLTPHCLQQWRWAL